MPCFSDSCTTQSLVNHLIKLKGSPLGYLREHLLVSAARLTLPALATNSGVLAVGCFFIFEAAVGIYWPSIGIVKSLYVPEGVRATVYNIFRVPLNLIVVIVLASLGSLSDNSVLLVCGLLLTTAAVMQHLFNAICMAEEAASSDRRGVGDEERKTGTTAGRSGVHDGADGRQEDEGKEMREHADGGHVDVEMGSAGELKLLSHADEKGTARLLHGSAHRI